MYEYEVSVWGSLAQTELSFSTKDGIMKNYDHNNSNAMESCGLNPKLIDECVGLVTEAITEETKWSRTVEKVEKYITDEKIPIRAIVYLLCFTILEHLEEKREKSKGGIK